MKRYTFLPAFFIFFCPLTAHLQVPPPPDSTAETDLKTFEKVEKEASYPDGVGTWRKFLEKNLNPLVPVNHGAPAGRYTVIVQFIVAKDGTISDVKALTNNGYGTEGEVIRLIKKSGKWGPAMQNGRPVNAYRKQPVTFIVTDDDLNVITNVPFTLFTKTDNESRIDNL